MNQIFPLLIILLNLVTLLLCAKSLPPDPNYVACSPFECGGVNITYPFWVLGHQPSYCGVQAFQIQCNGTVPIIILYDDPYVINSISYHELSINITNSAFSRRIFGCINSTHNFTSEDPRFNYFLAHKELLLLQDCRANASHSLAKSETIKCQNHDDGNRLSSFLAVYEKDLDYEKADRNCGRVIQVPYQDDYDDANNIEQVLRKGIILNYISTNCSYCQNSGGRCGYINSTSAVQCFCPDRPHKYHCHPEKSGKRRLQIILGTVLPGCVLIILAILIIYWKQWKIKQGSSAMPSRTIAFNWTRSDLEEGSLNGVAVFSYNELEKATNNFDTKRELGEGGFGIVYYGKLRDGREVAVKRLYEKNYKRIEQFKNEIQILTGLHHKNLVTLYGCTSRHCRELLLVYEYIPNGTVADHLHGDHAGLIPWSTRMNIAIETAEALSYLHFREIIHRDVKTNNLLLDNNFSVKVADFGLSRLFPADVTHVSTAPQGTPGYLDPEYHQCYHLTNKSDVYSFGVVLIELISSLPAVDIGRHRHEINLSNYAMNKIQHCSLNELVDPKLGYKTDFKVRRMTTLVAELAFQCLQQERNLRPSMDEVLKALTWIASVDYDAMEAEEMGISSGTTKVMEPLSSSTDSDDIGPVRNVTRPSPSPDSVTENSNKSLPSSTDDHDFGFLRNSQQPSSPDSITDEWFIKSTKSPPSPMDNDDVGLLKSAQQKASSSPNSVMHKWLSKSSTPNTSA